MTNTTHTPAAPVQPLLAIDRLEAAYGHASPVLRGLSLQVPSQGIVALLGANGAGKSTALKAVSGLLKSEHGRITGGQIRLDSERIDGAEPDAIVRRGVVQVMEGRRIVSDMSVVDNLRLGGYTRRDGARVIRRDIERVFSYFPRLRALRGMAGHLSGGEQQMLAIGRALMAQPRLILMDEPSMGLSPMMVHEVFAIIGRVNRELGIAILLVEQNVHAALQAASYAYVMTQGRVALHGPAASLIGHDGVRASYLSTHPVSASQASETLEPQS